jgi:hypothetical protein
MDWFLAGLMIGGAGTLIVFSLYLDYLGSSASFLRHGLAALLGAALGGMLTLV